MKVNDDRTSFTWLWDITCCWDVPGSLPSQGVRALVFPACAHLAVFYMEKSPAAALSVATNEDKYQQVTCFCPES